MTCKLRAMLDEHLSDMSLQKASLVGLIEATVAQICTASGASKSCCTCAVILAQFGLWFIGNDRGILTISCLVLMVSAHAIVERESSSTTLVCGQPSADQSRHIERK